MLRISLRPHHTAAWAIGCAVIVFTAWTALASREPSDRAVAEQLLSQASAWPHAASSGAQRPLAESKRALERAERARTAGDSVNAAHLEGLAREWAEFARDASNAIEAERHASTAQSNAAEAATRVKRARALLEEQMAKRARAQGELKKLRESGASAVGSTSVRVLMSAPKGSGAPGEKPSPGAGTSADPKPAAAPGGRP